MRRRTKNVDLVAAIAAWGGSQRELAARCGVRPETISHAVNRRVDPRPETVQTIATVLNVAPAQLGFHDHGGEA